MPQFYSPQEKARAIQILVENLGNTFATAQETGISERTIQRWKNDFTPKTVLIADDLQETAEALIRQRYVQIRNHHLDIVELLAAKILENPEKMGDYMLDYSRALHRLSKAEELASARSFTLVVMWEDREGLIRLGDDDMIWW